MTIAKKFRSLLSQLKFIIKFTKHLWVVVFLSYLFKSNHVAVM